MNKELIVLDIKDYEDSIDGTVWNRHAVDYNSESSNYEPYFFSCSKKPLMSIGFSCVIKKFQDIDKSKTWFINLVPHGNFYNSEYSDIFSSIPQHLINEINNGSAYLIINNENEYDTYKFYNHFYANHKKSTYIAFNKIFILSAGLLAKQQYNKFCIDNNLTKTERVKIIYSPHMNVLFNSGDINFFNSFKEPDVKTKKYTMFNREFRYHRPALVALLSEMDLLKYGHVSLGINQSKTKEAETQGGFEKHLKNIFNNQNVPPNVATVLNKGIAQISNQIPMCLDKTEFDTNYAQWFYTPVDLMLDSYFHITSCTHYFDWQEPSPGWHEKEWKPILVRQPFIMFGRPGMLNLLRRFGFLTFSRWFDESYDEVDNDWHRMMKIVEEVKRLCSLSDEEWKKMLTEMAPVLEYNYQVLIHKKYELFFHGSDLKNLVEYI